MLVRRFYDDRLAQASYLIACQRTGDAIVVDPSRQVAQYIDAARSEGVKIRHVTETHIHADFVSGARELAQATGAQVHLSGEGGPDWQYGWAAAANASLLHEGDQIVLGGVHLDVMHTPGHTPEHVAFLVTDSAVTAEPVALVSGDFVFVGDVGRPDLLEKVAGAANTQASAARALYHSVRRLAELPDFLQVWPGHGAGSSCGKALGALPTSTLGYERLTSWAFQAADEASFVANVLAGQPNPPPYFARMKQVNRDGPALLGALGAVAVLSADLLDDARSDGLLLDTRPRTVREARPVRGALTLPLGRDFLKWAGWLVPADRDISLLVVDVKAANDARDALLSIGIEHVRGAFVSDAVEPETSAAPHAARIAQAASLHADGTRIIDLRESDEWFAGHLEFAEHQPLGTLANALQDADRDAPIALHCQGGGRSAIGASMLTLMGFNNVTDLKDGWSGLSAKP